MKKEKFYQIEFERKPSQIIISIILGIVSLAGIIYLFNRLDLMNKLMEFGDTNFLNVMSFLGYLASLALLIWILAESCIEFYKWMKFDDDGTLSKEKIQFQGILKEVKEIKEPVKSRPKKQKIKYNIVWEEK